MEIAMDAGMDYQTLKQQHRALREGFSENLSLRTHRALSWLQRAEMCDQDLDAKFIFLWIAFNAIYAQDLDNVKMTEAETFAQFIKKLIDIDSNKHLHNLIWDEFSGSIRILLDNKYVFKPFWDFHNGKISESEWETRFSDAKAKVSSALSHTQTDIILKVVLSRLYTLRNQMIHGGATWNSSVNRDQLRDATKFLQRLVPSLIVIMMANPNQLWGDANYPVVKE
jgi:hypothetical protein